MKEYTIAIKETLLKEVTIEAKSVTEAISKVDSKYKNEEIILDYNDLYNMEIYIPRKKKK